LKEFLMKPQTHRPTALRRLVLPAVVVALAAWAASPARADNIDVGLIKKAPEILKYLKDKKYKNVGVLRFQLKKGGGKATYAAGPINRNVADRLENVLLMEIDPNNPVGVIRDASAVAAKNAPKKHWVEGDAAQRATLFGYTYPLAWETDKVKPDAFLHGIVKLSEDMRTTTVLVACFDGKSDDEHTVCKFDVKTDRTILADSGQSYVLSRGIVKKRGVETDNGKKTKDGKNLDDLLNEDAVNSAKDRDQKKVGNGGNGGNKPSALANEYLDFEVFYDDQSQPITGDPNEGGELRINPPRTGQTVEFRMKKKTQDDIGVVLFVNGTSTLEYMRDPPEKCRRWIFPADGQSYWIRGYVDENDVRTPFKIVGAGDDLIKNELADRLGLIEACVFLKGSEPTSNGEMLVSRNLNLRSLSPYYLKKMGGTKKPKTPVEARALAFKHAGLKVPVKSRALGDGEEGFIVPDPELRDQLTIEQREFPNPTAVATPIVIRYNDKPANN